jgi:hypothetical protein
MTDQQEPQMLPPEDAKDILENAIADKLGDDWENDKWVVVTNTAYMARLNKGRVNVDFYVDYFSGDVTVETSEVDLGQETGKLFAWMMLGLFAVITLLLARGLGYI